MIKHALKIACVAILVAVYLTHPTSSADWAAWVQAIGVLGSIAIAIGLAQDQRKQQTEIEPRSRWRRLAVIKAVTDHALRLIEESAIALRNRETALAYIRTYSDAEYNDVYDTLKGIAILELQAYEGAVGLMKVRHALDRMRGLLVDVRANYVSLDNGYSRIVTSASMILGHATAGALEIGKVNLRAWKEVEALIGADTAMPPTT